MNHLFRLAWLLLTAPWRQAHSDMKRPTVLSFRVWPTDLDPLFHMNNGVYLSLMDLGRIDLMLKAGAFHKIRRAGIYPVIVSEAIRFRKSLTPFQAFKMHTRIATWDDKYYYLFQHFLVGDEVYASALVKGRFLRRSGGKVSPQELNTFLNLHENEATPVRAADLLAKLEGELGDENARHSHIGAREESDERT